MLRDARRFGIGETPQQGKSGDDFVGEILADDRGDLRAQRVRQDGPRLSRR